MTPGEIAFLAAVVGAFTLFGVTLGIVSGWSERAPTKANSKTKR